MGAHQLEIGGIDLESLAGQLVQGSRQRDQLGETKTAPVAVEVLADLQNIAWKMGISPTRLATPFVPTPSIDVSRFERFDVSLVNFP